jgi:hypothetical protein
VKKRRLSIEYPLNKKIPAWAAAAHRRTRNISHEGAKAQSLEGEVFTTKHLARLRRNQIGKKMFTTKDTKITKFGV